MEKMKSIKDLFNQCQQELKGNFTYEFLKEHNDNFGNDTPGGVNSLKNLLGELVNVYKDKKG